MELLGSGWEHEETERGAESHAALTVPLLFIEEVFREGLGVVGGARWGSSDAS